MGGLTTNLLVDGQVQQAFTKVVNRAGIKEVTILVRCFHARGGNVDSCMRQHGASSIDMPHHTHECMVDDQSYQSIVSYQMGPLDP
jgi:hypothetical protein